MTDISQYIVEIGALGIAAYGVVEALGKALCIGRFEKGKWKRDVGLPYVGFREVRHLIRELGAALKLTYGDQYEEILRQQYRADRGKGQAPDTIMQGVRLGLPLLSEGEGTTLIKKVWGLEGGEAEALIRALKSEKQASSGKPPKLGDADRSALQKLAGRFTTALDMRVEATFSLAEEQYQATARLWAAIAAVAMSVGYGATEGHLGALGPDALLDVFIGLVAVPLAPVAKDLASSLSDALNSLNRLSKLRKA